MGTQLVGRRVGDDWDVVNNIDEIRFQTHI
jgi:hypothetical protein